MCGNSKMFIQRISLLVDNREITPHDLPPEITETEEDLAGQVLLTADGIDVDEIIGNIEKRYILQALDKAHGVKTEAAKLLRLSFRSFPSQTAEIRDKVAGPDHVFWRFKKSL